jgi:hypothetical protein
MSEMQDEDGTTIEVVEGADGQLLADVDDMLVLLRHHARRWFGDDSGFLERFDHVVEGAIDDVKEHHRKWTDG